MTTDTPITWTPALVDEFRAVYQANIDQELFKFHGVTFLTAYAKYLLEYLDELIEESSSLGGDA